MHVCGSNNSLTMDKHRYRVWCMYNGDVFISIMYTSIPVLYVLHLVYKLREVYVYIYSYTSQKLVELILKIIGVHNS